MADDRAADRVPSGEARLGPSPGSVRSGEFRLKSTPALHTSTLGESAHRKRELKEVRERVEKLVDEQRLAILRTIGRLNWFAVVPVMATVTALQLSRQRDATWLLVVLLGLVVTGIGTNADRLSISHRGSITTMGIAAAGGAALLHFGPTLSIGFFHVAATLVAAMLLRPVQAYAVGAALWGVIAVQAILSLFGTDITGASELQFQSDQWLRLALTSAIGTFGLLYLFMRIQGNLWRAVEGQLLLRASERRLVEEREVVLRAASSAQRLESLGRLAGGIAHDFNNSLVVIQCNLEALSEELNATEKAEVLHEIGQGVDRAAATARQLLSFAKRNVEEIGACDPSIVAHRLEKDAKRLLPPSIRLVVESAEANRVALTPVAVEQLFMIFIQNSREALGQLAGTITVRVSSDQKRGCVALEVRDDGPGMPEEVLEQACEPFFTTRGESRAGLGLSTAWGMVHRQGGELIVESEVGRGTRIVVTLPVAPAEPEEAPKPRAASRKSRAEEYPVLVLEDEVPVRTAFRRILKHSGLRVVEVGTVREARAATASARFSLLISDGVLPDGGVGHFIREFREAQGAPVILCSGYTEEDLALEGLARGQWSFLPKPFSAADLNELVTQLLEKKSKSSPG